MTKYVIKANIEVDFDRPSKMEASKTFRQFMRECGIVHFVVSEVEEQ